MACSGVNAMAVDAAVVDATVVDAAVVDAAVALTAVLPEQKSCAPFKAHQHPFGQPTSLFAYPFNPLENASWACSVHPWVFHEGS